MVLQSNGCNGYGVRELRLWCQRVMVMVLQSNGYADSREQTQECDTKQAYLFLCLYVFLLKICTLVADNS